MFALQIPPEPAVAGFSFFAQALTLEMPSVFSFSPAFVTNALSVEVGD